MKQLLVKKSNDLPMCRYDLNLVQYRILCFCNGYIYHQIEEEPTMILIISEFAEVFSVKLDTAKKQIRSSISILSESGFYKKDKKGNELHIKWFDEISYINNEKIKIVFSEDCKTFMFNLKAYFFTYGIDKIHYLDGKYSIRIYEIMLSRSYPNKSIDIQIEELRYILCLGEKYKDTEALNRLLTRNINEINQKTNIDVSVKYSKMGKSIIGYEFSVKFKDYEK